jgi:hypothetical protein
MAFAQTGSIGLFSDVAGTICDVYDPGGILVMVYVVHVYTPGATGAQFIVADMWGNAMTYIAETVTAPYLKIGTCAGPGATGCAIAYGACMPSPNMMLMIQYFSMGMTPPCSYLQVMADPTATPPGIYVTDCSDPPNLLAATGGDVVINPIAGCFCDIPVEETSWGQIKNLYQ